MIFSRPKPVVDPKAIESFLSRGVENVFPSKDSFAKALSSGKRLKIYLGVDPTGPTLHIGHAIPMMKLAELQKMGHEVIFLIGDFTAMIGDPDKLSARKQLSRKEVIANLKLYKKQAASIISFSGKNAAKVVYNSSWLMKMSFADVIDLASHMTLQQMLERDMFKKRVEEGKPVSLHEFMYPLMQGFDSVAMQVDAEIGGNDQTFNMLVGRDLMRSMKGKEKLVLAVKLLADPSGKKMGKTEGNMIALSDSAEEMFGKVMSWSDGMILSGFELATKVSDEAIAAEKAFLEKGGNPRDSKQKLALAVAELYHGKHAAEKAKASFIGAFAEGGMPADALTASVASGTPLVDVLVANGIASSKTDFRRLIEGKAVKDVRAGTAIEDIGFAVSADLDLKVGKHRFIKIRLK